MRSGSSASAAELTWSSNERRCMGRTRSATEGAQKRAFRSAAASRSPSSRSRSSSSAKAMISSDHSWSGTRAASRTSSPTSSGRRAAPRGRPGRRTRRRRAQPGRRSGAPRDRRRPRPRPLGQRRVAEAAHLVASGPRQVEAVPHRRVADARVDEDDHFLPSPSPESSSTARNASWGTSMRPTCFMRFLPSFCLSRSLRLRVMSPP